MDILFNQIAEIARPKFCGDSSIVINARIKIYGVVGEDSFLNGITGTSTHPFASGETSKGWIGIYVDPDHLSNPYGDKLNVHQDNVRFLPY